MKRRHHHNHHNRKKTSNKCCMGGGKPFVMSKTLLLTCSSPLIIAASSNHHQRPLHWHNRGPRSHPHHHEHYVTCNHRKRQRIKSQDQRNRHLILKHILYCRGGDGTMDDHSNSMDPYAYDTHLNHQRANVIPAAATESHPSRMLYDGIDDDNDIMNSHSSDSSPHAASNNPVNVVINTSLSSAVTNTNNQLNGGSSSQQDDDITESDTLSNQTLQNQSIPSPNPLVQQQPQWQRQRLMVEFDTQAIGNSDRIRSDNSIRSRIRSRIGNENDWDRIIMRQQRRGTAALSISLDLSPRSGSSSSSSSNSSLDYYGARSNSHIASRSTTAATLSSGSHNIINNTTPTPNNNLSTATINTIATTYTLLQQSLLLLPPLLLTRRALNSTRNAIVDYFRGRIFRQTFTRMERAYLRYYEFPAAIRAVARLGSQIGILLGLSVAVRCWMFMILAGDVVGPLVLGMMSGMDIREDIGMVGTSSVGGGGGVGLDSTTNGFDGILGNVWNVGLPCYQRGRGMAWLCGLIWIGAVVGTGHACTVAISVWGGPLRLQAAAVQEAEKPKQILLRAVHHPFKWVRELEEWKHLPNLPKIGRKVGTRRRRGGGESRVLDLDPLLFPATWLPLRWIQIFAVAKAFSTDPQNYRWCSAENDRIVIPKLMKQYLFQLALGDEWQRVFLGEKRVGLGIVVVMSYFIALVWMVFTAFTLDGGSAAMLIPSVLAAIISGGINVMLFWNRLGSRSQKKALEAIGWA